MVSPAVKEPRSAKKKKNLFNNFVFESKENDITTLGTLNLASVQFGNKGSSTPERQGKVFEGFSAINPLSSATEAPNPTDRHGSASPASGKTGPSYGVTSDGETVHVKVFAPDVSQEAIDNAADSDGEDESAKVAGCTSATKQFSLEIPQEPLPVAGRRAYLTAPCDGCPTIMTVHRHQAAGLLELYLETQHSSLFLGAAYKRRGAYTLFQDRGDSNTSSPSYMGKVLISANHTEYVLEEFVAEKECKRTACVFFKKRFSATGVPRSLTALIPERAGDGLPAKDLTRVARKDATAMTGLRALKNALPVWDPEAKGYVLDMSQRIRLPSVKNFQMKECKPGESKPEGTVLMEFGKSTASTFALECRAPLSILQAFTISVAMIDSSLLVTM